ncbi:hypothetical protein A9Q83_13285 [Alphaproteobacteria bacterium 46_93_T64]|nr:hypothetical protein A9Q83_13285 [Alphaproteobacteria bacterium 46_93_T64]
MNYEAHNRTCVILLGSQKGVLADMKMLNSSDPDIQLFSPEEWLKDIDHQTREVAVFVANLTELDGKQQKTILDICQLAQFTWSELILLYDLNDCPNMLPEVVARASTLTSSSKNPNQLFEIITTSKRNYQQKAAIRKDLNNTLNAFKLMDKGVFKLKTLDEAKSISILLATLCPDSAELSMGLLELLINAIEHGNLEITFDEKGKLLQNGQWLQEIERRQQLPQNSEKQVTIEYVHKPDRIEFTITDEGSGFNPEKFLTDEMNNPIESNPTCFHGRGIKLASRMYFDQLEYVGVGKQVKAAIELR